MLERYIDFINLHISDPKGQKLLLAVSGGVDSMVMLDLSIKSGLDIAVAHIDHAMRGESSALDAELVRVTCKRANVQYHLYTFNDQEKAISNFQEKARNIRYEWWKSLCRDYGYDYIFTAHHSSDSVETFFINLSRGAGIKGLTGIPVQNGNVFRPISDMTKKDVLAYATEENIVYREDSSNRESKYKRNIVRNEWLPHLQKYDSDLEQNVLLTISNLKRDRSLLDSLVTKEISKYISFRNKRSICIDIENLQSENQYVAVDLLYHYLKVFRFTYDTCAKCFIASTGAEFHSDISELLRDRDSLLLRAKHDDPTIDVTIKEYGQTVVKGSLINVSQNSIKASMPIYNLDLPFKIRTRKDGDRFKPAGMNGKSKKVKDFLTDIKLDKWAKQETLVIEKDELVVAVLPYRVAYGYEKANTSGPIYISIP